MVEHYPKLGSCSPSFIDPDMDESRFSRGRFRSIRRHSVSKSRRTDSIATPRPSGSPLNVNNKFNAMAFLQVPATASSTAYEEKVDPIMLEKEEGIGGPVLWLYILFMCSSILIFLSQGSDQTSLLKGCLPTTLKMEESRQIPFPTTQQVNLLACSAHCTFDVERQAGKLQISIFRSSVLPNT